MVKKVRHLIKSSCIKVIIQTDHSAILDILEQSSITSTSFTIRLKFQLVRPCQFLQQFKSNVQYKPDKEYIILDVLSRLASSNIGTADLFYLKLDALYVYNTILIKIHPKLVFQILAGYDSDLWWEQLH